MQRSTLSAVAVVLVLMVVTPAARAGETEPGVEDPGAMVSKGVELLLQGLQQFLVTIPAYGSPRILPNGDILIPRRERPPELDTGESQKSL